METVKQCYKCFRFGHFKDKCNAVASYPTCGEGKHEVCDKKAKCLNCQGSHKATFKGCLEYERNKDLKVIMTYRNYSFYEAERLADGKEFLTPLNFNKFTVPQKWSDLPYTVEAKKGITSDKQKRNIIPRYEGSYSSTSDKRSSSISPVSSPSGQADPCLHIKR